MMTSNKPMTTQKDPKNEDKVMVDKKALKHLQDEIKSLQEMKEMFFAVADKKAMSRYLASKRGKLPALVKVRHIRGKVIVGWETIENEVWKDENDRWHEKQYVKIIFEDGTARQMSLREFNRDFRYYQCQRIGTETDEEGNVKYKLKRLDNGEVYSLPVQFVN